MADRIKRARSIGLLGDTYFICIRAVEGDTSIVTLELFIVIVVYDDDDVDIVDPLWCIVTHYCCGALVVNKLFK